MKKIIHSLLLVSVIASPFAVHGMEDTPNNYMVISWGNEGQPYSCEKNPNPITIVEVCAQNNIHVRIIIPKNAESILIEE